MLKAFVESLDALPLAALALEPSTDAILAWNSTAQALFRIDAAQALGRRFCEWHLSDRIPRLRRALEEVRATPATVRLPEVPCALTDGVPLTLTMTLSPLLDDDGRAAAVLLFFENLTDTVAARRERERLLQSLEERDTEREIAHEELRSLNDHLEAANTNLEQKLVELEAAHRSDREKDQFLAMLAHELRNPLGAITTGLHLLECLGPADPRAATTRTIVSRQVQHLGRLLDDLLDVARITVGKVTLRGERVDLRSLVVRAVEAEAPRIAAKEHVLDVPDPGEAIVVEVDPDRVQQVIANLLNNAVKYTPSHGRVSLTATRADGAAVLTVRDSGRGFPPEQREAIFGLFTQLDRTAGDDRGLGIGLTLSRRLAEAHGGTLVADSEGPGTGSTFTLRLPLARLDRVETAPAPAPEPEGPGPRRIVVIEDNRDVRQILVDALTLEGHRVEAAADGVTGLALALAARPDVVLIDLGLPGLDGYEVARSLRRALGPAAVLIAVTGYGQPDDRRRSREAGFDAHCIKPFSPEQLRELLAHSPPRPR